LDEPRIEQVLYNFVNNAYNLTRRGGWIRIELSGNLDNVRIEVIDNGEGISAEE
jgi:two-component system, chemotaxis family, CheB/CheR fusion protein